MPHYCLSAGSSNHRFHETMEIVNCKNVTNVSHISPASQPKYGAFFAENRQKTCKEFGQKWLTPHEGAELAQN